MFLLSDVADRIRADVLSLSSASGADVRLHQETRNLRVGDERALIELLTLSMNLVGRCDGSLMLELDADEDEIRVRYGGDAEVPEGFPSSLSEKIEAMGGRIDGDGVLHVPAPTAKSGLPVDIEAMSRRTGMPPGEARRILGRFLKHGKADLDLLTAEDARIGGDTRFRAAHSLKGAGRALCAPELAAAAAEVEKDIGRNADASESIRRLTGVWESIEEWYSEDTNDGQNDPVR